MRTAAAAVLRYTKTVSVALMVSKRADSARPREEPGSDAKRQKVDRREVEKERRAHGDFSDMWCKACLRKGHPASTTDESLYACAVSSGRAYAAIPDKIRDTRRARIESWRKANPVQPKN